MRAFIVWTLVNTAIRWLRKNPRWAYSVAGPNALWHNDGLHKLIHWKFVIHGCIDGHTRLITYLKCAPDNKGSTVLGAFLEAVKKFGVPARVRGDHGKENFALAEYFRNLKSNWNAYIQGPSVHNQRIERLHYDTTHCVLSHFIDLFLFMEEHMILDRCNDIDLFCLHRIYLPKIQNSLDCFVEGWNHHPISTEKNKSPYQLFARGMMNKNFQDQPGVTSYLQNNIIDEEDFYGASFSTCYSDYFDDDAVEIEEINLGDKVKQVEETLLRHDFTSDDGNFGINNFISLKKLVYENI